MDVEVALSRRWWVTVGAIVAAVVLLVGALSWRIATALPATWVSLTPGATSATPLPTGAQWTATIPAGWKVPADTFGAAVALVDASGNRILGDQFGKTAERACEYLVDQALSYQKYTRTDITGVTVDGRSAVSVRLEAGNESHLFRCFVDKAGKEAWYLAVHYKPQDKDAVERAFAQFADSFRLR